MLYPLPSYIVTAVSALAAEGCRAYLVGGCVRDIVRGAVPHDYDIAVPFPPEKTAACFEGYTVIPDGIRHGTVAVMICGEKVEITTFRSEEGYTDGRHPDGVNFIDDIITDLSRRDFTVNAMALPCEEGESNVDTGNLIDPFGGCEDIRRRLIRCVGDAERRFGEDGLRILRALRFSSVLGYGIEEKTADAVRSCSHMLDSVSRERVADELYRIVCGEDAGKVISGFSGVIRGAAGEAPENAAKLRDMPCDPLSRMILVFGGATPDMLRRLRRSGNEIGSAMRICGAMGNVPDCREDVYRLLIRLGTSDLGRYTGILSAKGDISREKAEKIRNIAAKIISDKMPLSVTELALTGSDLMAVGFYGRDIGKAKERLLGAVIEGKAENTAESLLGYIGKQ